MMNEARVSVGAGAMALGYTGYLHALQYAEERTQGRPLAAKDPAAPPVRLVDHPDVRRMLLAQKSYVEGALALVLYCARLVDEVSDRHDRRGPRGSGHRCSGCSPRSRSRGRRSGAWPPTTSRSRCTAATATPATTPVEQFYRDNRLNPIHEGTHGIQALDLLGRKVVVDGGRGLGLLADRIRATVTRGAGRRRRRSGVRRRAGSPPRRPARRHRDPLGGRRPGAGAGQRHALPGGGRAPGRRLAVARAAARGRRRHRRVLRRQARGRAVLLPLRAAHRRPQARAAGQPRPDHARPGPGLAVARPDGAVAPGA